MWCLGRLLPLLIGQLVPEEDRLWENYLTLLSIMDYAFAPVTTADKADYMAMLVEDFLVEFCVLYPERRLIPKMHYMIHLPTWMKRSDQKRTTIGLIAWDKGVQKGSTIHPVQAGGYKT